VSFGILDSATRGFVPQSVVRASDTIAIRFEVANIGTKTSGAWTFKAELPTNARDTFQSVVQQSLNPGDRIVYTLSFNDVRANGGIFTITADPDNRVPESSSANNGIAYTVRIVE
jgi:hypothetical protein